MMNMITYMYYMVYITTTIFIFKDNYNIINRNMKESNFFTRSFYNNKLSRIFYEDDYDFFRLVFVKFLIKVQYLNKYVHLGDVKESFEKIMLSMNINHQNEMYMKLYEEIKKIGEDKRYKELYENNNINIEIEKRVRQNRNRITLLSLLPFDYELKTLNGKESYKKIQLLLDILYVSIIISYHSLFNNKERKNMLILMYENTINQWMSLNYLRKIMKYELSLNNDGILMYISLNKKKERTKPKEINIKLNNKNNELRELNKDVQIMNDIKIINDDIIKNIENKFKHIINEHIQHLYPNVIGKEKLSFLLNKLMNVYIPPVRVIGYATFNKHNLYTTDENIKINNQFTEEYFNINKDKVVIQVMIGNNIEGNKETTRQNDDNKNKGNYYNTTRDDYNTTRYDYNTTRDRSNNYYDSRQHDNHTYQNNPAHDIHDFHFTIEYMYNIFMNYIFYNDDSFLDNYKYTSFITSKYIFGDKQHNKAKEEKKYEDLSLHIFLRIKKKLKFTFSHLQKFFFKNFAYISSLYDIYFYGGCLKYQDGDMIKVVGHFGEGIDIKLINNVLIKMNIREIIIHIKLSTKKRKAHEQNESYTYITIKQIKKQINNSNIFHVIYTLVDSTKLLPKHINCITCRNLKYHYIILLITAIVPSLIIFIIFYIIYYWKDRNCSNSKKKICTNHISQTYPCFFHFKTHSNRYIRLSEKKNPYTRLSKNYNEKKEDKKKIKIKIKNKMKSKMKNKKKNKKKNKNKKKQNMDILMK
ncbi:hypothetical protein PRSY57_1130300 [Plasmodium reichenowi]|uniref:Uncharacterized protein n=1 Tax=Plasmodium reichenowi TaxID=5854 RepID=A0A151LCF0_PLARE|nr:hypothetical protein PRSY57_1130300 [Plasmodium reichenowi]KYN96654.1 hypothetical protein PRSY57_1130300 [Plasmodium reichenowi]